MNGLVLSHRRPVRFGDLPFNTAFYFDHSMYKRVSDTHAWSYMDGKTVSVPADALVLIDEEAIPQ